MVWVDPKKIDAGWATDKGFYVGPNGTYGSIGNRYANFGEWLKGGEAVEMSEVGFDYNGIPFFTNGRHRFAWMRDHGAAAIPVVTNSDQAEEFFKKFGTRARLTTVR